MKGFASLNFRLLLCRVYLGSNQQRRRLKFRLKGFATGFVLKKKSKGTWKWPSMVYFKSYLRFYCSKIETVSIQEWALGNERVLRLSLKVKMSKT